MAKHYILSLNPTASDAWEQCTLRDPMTASRPDLAHLIANALGQEPGSYLVAVNIEVQVLEQVPLVDPITAAASLSSAESGEPLVVPHLAPQFATRADLAA